MVDPAAIKAFEHLTPLARGDFAHRLQMDIVNPKCITMPMKDSKKPWYQLKDSETNGTSSHARQSPNYACFDGNRLSPRPGNWYLYALWAMRMATGGPGAFYEDAASSFSITGKVL